MATVEFEDEAQEPEQQELIDPSISLPCAGASDRCFLRQSVANGSNSYKQSLLFPLNLSMLEGLSVAEVIADSGTENATGTFLGPSGLKDWFGTVIPAARRR